MDPRDDERRCAAVLASLFISFQTKAITHMLTSAPDLDLGGAGARRGGRPHLRIQNVKIGDDR